MMSHEEAKAETQRDTAPLLFTGFQTITTSGTKGIAGEPDPKARPPKRRGGPPPPDLFSRFATITQDGKTGDVAKRKHR